MVTMVLLMAGAGGAQAQYQRPSTQEKEESHTFEEAVDLNRFRDGNMAFETQELIASGFKALHEDNLKILKEIEELKVKMRTLEERLNARPAAPKREGY